MSLLVDFDICTNYLYLHAYSLNILYKKRRIKIAKYCVTYHLAFLYIIGLHILYISVS